MLECSRRGVCYDCGPVGLFVRCGRFLLGFQPHFLAGGMVIEGSGSAHTVLVWYAFSKTCGEDNSDPIGTVDPFSHSVLLLKLVQVRQLSWLLTFNPSPAIRIALRCPPPPTDSGYA